MVRNVGGFAVPIALRRQLHPSKNKFSDISTARLVTAGRYWWICPEDDRHEWEAVLASRIAGAGCPYCSNQRVLKGFNDLATTAPLVAKSLHPKLNTKGFAETVTAGSKKLAWWQCPVDKKHVFDMSVSSRAKTSCPLCSGRRVVVGINDLATTNPKLLREWHPTKNLPILPTQVVEGTGKSIWWQCNSNSSHEWFVTGDTRVRTGSGCPVCAGQKLNSGENDLQSKYPNVAALWNFKNNSPVIPSEIFPKTTRKYWWMCDKGLGHTYEASALSMVASSYCRICSNSRFETGVNDLATTHPHLAKEWHPTKNGKVTPFLVTASKSAKFWWKCSRDPRHVWNASLKPRASKGIGCPVCSFDLILPGVNDFATLFPDQASQWHKTLNGTLKPTEISPANKTKIWWQCSINKKHVWQTTVGARSKGAGCLFCSRQLVFPGETDLASTHPELAKEWHPTKNGNLLPTEIIAGSGKAFWWKCTLDDRHEWRTSGANRVGGKGCPICSQKIVVPGLNDMMTTNPEMMPLWDYDKNSNVDPSKITAGTHAKFWWKCENNPDHSWRSTGVSIKLGSRCPSCINPGFDQTRQSTFYFIENSKLLARKVGITNDGRRLDRVSEFAKQGWSPVMVLGDKPGWKIQELETQVLRWIRSDLGLPPFLSTQDVKSTGGASETFSIDGPVNDEIVKKIYEIMTTLGLD